jgi:hypothetical protein
VPARVPNTHSEALGWCLRASIAVALSLLLRLLAVFGVLISPLENARRTCRIPDSRVTSCHCSPSNSPVSFLS